MGLKKDRAIETYNISHKVRNDGTGSQTEHQRVRKRKRGSGSRTQNEKKRGSKQSAKVTQRTEGYRDKEEDKE